MTEEKCLPTEVTTEREGSREGGRGAGCCWCIATRKYLTNIQTSVQTSDLQTTAKVN